MEMKATKKDIAAILFRGLSIYSFVKATEILSDKFIYFFNAQNYSFMILIQMIGPPSLLVICGVIIWHVSPNIAAHLSNPSCQDEKYGFSLNDVQDLAFSAIGLFLIVNAIPDIVYGIGFYYGIVSQSRADKNLAYVSGNTYLAALVIKFVLGIWLLIGSHGIGKIVRAMHRD
jgi:hypothetical protein